MPFPLVLNTPILIFPCVFTTKSGLGWERGVTLDIFVSSPVRAMAVSSFFNLQYNKEQLGSCWRPGTAVNCRADETLRLQRQSEQRQEWGARLPCVRSSRCKTRVIWLRRAPCENDSQARILL